jgi:hypothetical protein
LERIVGVICKLCACGFLYDGYWNVVLFECPTVLVLLLLYVVLMIELWYRGIAWRR